MLVLPATPDTISSFIEQADAAGEELSTIATVMLAPALPFLPAETHGQAIILAMMVYAGDASEVEAGTRAIAPFRSNAKPIADMVRPMRYPEIYPPETGDHPVGSSRTLFLESIDRSVAETILEHLRTSSARMAAVEIRVLGGAMARVSVEATAFAHRRARMVVNIAARYEHPQEAVVHQPWVTDLATALRPAGGGAYAGFLADDGPARIREAYPGATWQRLAAVKKRYDPTNLFHLNHNITPA
jgi:hypothetical protein